MGQVIDLKFDKEIVPHGIAGFDVLQLPVFQRSRRAHGRGAGPAASGGRGERGRGGGEGGGKQSAPVVRGPWPLRGVTGAVTAP